MRRKLVLEVFLALSLVPFTSNAAERHHYGDLVLRGAQSLTVDSETLYVHGNVYLYDSSVLTVRNGASIIIVQTYHEEFNFYLHEQARLVVEKATLDASFDMCIIYLRNEATLIADNAYIDHEIGAQDNSTLRLTRSYLLGLEIAHPSAQTQALGKARIFADHSRIHELSMSFVGSCEVSFIGVRPGSNLDFTITQANVGRGTIAFELIFVQTTLETAVNLLASSGASLQVQHSEVHQLNVIDDAVVLAEHSTITQPVITVSKVYAIVNGLPVGHIDDWTLRAVEGRMPCKFILRDTVVAEGWYLRLRGGRLEIRNAVVARLRDEFDDVGSRYRLVNCCIEEWMPWWDHGTVVLENCVLGVIQTPDGATPTLKGNFCVLEPAVSEFWGPWRNNSTITREFPVVVRAADGRPAPNVAVELRDARGQLLQTCYTDQNGQALLTIVFDERNYKDLWTVRVPQLNSEQPFGLTSFTPIQFPVTTAPCPDLPCRQQMAMQGSVPGAGTEPLKPGEPFIAWNDAHVLARSSRIVADDPNLDITYISAAIDDRFLYLRMGLRGVNPDQTGHVSVYEFYLRSAEGNWDRFYKVNLSRGTLDAQYSDSHVLIESTHVECRITGASVEVAVPRSFIVGTRSLHILAQTRIFPDRVVDTAEGVFRLPGST